MLLLWTTSICFAFILGILFGIGICVCMGYRPSARRAAQADPTVRMI